MESPTKRPAQGEPIKSRESPTKRQAKGEPTKETEKTILTMRCSRQEFEKFREEWYAYESDWRSTGNDLLHRKFFQK